MERSRVEEKQRWGTWEELLLVSAVNRHGTRNWDSVAMEVQNRTNSFLTPHNCKERYQHLRRRFMEIDDDGGEDSKHDVSKSKSKTDSKLDDDTIPWLDELRKLRVAELKREVQQYDVSIVSLQLKVKRLREERERSSKEENGGEVKPDLDEEIRPEPSSSSAAEETETTTVEVVAGKPNSGEDENQSFNESNSTDPKSENTRVSGESESDKKLNTIVDPVGGGEKPVGEGSSNGSSETIKDSAVSRAFEKSLETIPKREPGESTELWESVDDSKDSDVQSSASLSSKENLRRKEVSVSSSGEEPETDEISPAIKRISVKSHPLGKVLEMIKSHKYGNVFERRLDSQETSKYKSLIRQHMDLETIHKRLKEGQYSDYDLKFFRDLLLLINNSLVFYPNNSTEFKAAMDIRRIITKEMKSRTRKLKQSRESQPSILPPSLPKAEPEPQKPSVPLIVCRKRSSIASKGERKVEKKEEKKPVQDNGVASMIEEEMVIKKGKRDKPRIAGKSHESTEKAEKEKQSNNPVGKKRSVANFLNRMKKNTSSSSSNGGGGVTLLESLKGGSVEQKKTSGGGGRKEEGTTRKRKHSSSPAKRSVGRPPKKNASPSPVAPPPAKRSKEMVEVEVVASKQPPPRKRSKK